MGHIRDRWTDPNPATGRRVKNERWGRGRRWAARWTDADGIERSKAFPTRDEAEVHLAQLLAGVTPTTTDSPTFGAYVERWRRQQVDHRPNTRNTVAGRLDARILPTFRDRQIAAIDRAEVQDAIAAWSAAGAAPATVRAAYKLFGTIMRSAQRDKLIDALPFDRRMKLPKIDSEPVVPLTGRQLELLADLVGNGRLRSMVMVGAASGLRLGELRGLTADRVLRGGRIKVDRQLALDGKSFAPLKTDASFRIVDLGEVAAGILQDHLDTTPRGPHGLVWTNATGGPLAHYSAVTAWQNARNAVDDDGKPLITGLRKRSGWHDLRHFSASLLIAAGLSPVAVAARLGHDDPGITLKIYSHLWPTDQSAAVAAIDAALKAAA